MSLVGRVSISIEVIVIYLNFGDYYLQHPIIS